METQFWIIAICLTAWTVGFLFVALAMVIVAFKISGTVRRLERMVEDLKRDVMPIVYQGRNLADDFKSMGKDVKKQLAKSEHLFEETVRNVSETTGRVRDAVTGIALILSAIGRLVSPLSSRDKK